MTEPVAELAGEPARVGRVDEETVEILDRAREPSEVPGGPA